MRAAVAEVPNGVAGDTGRLPATHAADETKPKEGKTAVKQPVRVWSDLVLSAEGGRVPELAVFDEVAEARGGSSGSDGCGDGGGSDVGAMWAR